MVCGRTATGWILAAAFSLALASTGILVAQVCPAPAGKPAFGGTNEASISDMVVRGEYAYGADDYGLGVWDVSDPTQPVHVSHWMGADLYGTAVALGPETQVLLGRGSGFSILDLSDPCAPRELGLFENSWVAQAVAVDGDIAFVGYRAPVLDLIDISNPANPVLRGSYIDHSGSRINAIEVEDDVVYLVMGSSFGPNELQLIDVSDPQSPTLVGTYQADRGIDCFAVAGNFVYLGVFDEGFQIVDVSEPTEPTLLGSLVLPYEAAFDVKVSGGLAFVGIWGTDLSDYWGGLKIIDISVPASPFLLGESIDSFLMDGFVEISGTTAFIPSYDYVYGSDRSRHGFVAVDVSDPVNPERLGANQGNGKALGIAVSGTNAVVANGWAGLELVDFTKPSAMMPLGSLETGKFVGSVAVAGDVAYLAEEEAGIRTVDISDPWDPMPLGFFPISGDVADVAVEYGVVHVANGRDGLLSIDVSDPRNPVYIRTYYDPDEFSWVWNVTVVEGLAFASIQNRTLVIIDVSDPQKPTLVGSLEEGFGQINDIAAADAKVFLADTVGLTIVDVSDPAEPVVVGSIILDGVMEAVTISGDLAYVSADSRGVYVIDVSDPTNPMLLDTLETSGKALDAAVVGNTVFVAAEMYLEAFTTECRSPLPEIVWESRGLEVDFSDTSLFGPTSWFWDFGDGAKSDDQHPTHRYDAHGSYAVSLTVTNDFGSQTTTWSLRIPDGRNECRPARAN